LKQLRDAVSTRIGVLFTAQGEKLDTVTGQITALTEGNERRQEILRANVEAKLGELNDVRVYYLSFAYWARDESCPIVRD
jgi:hypothetical protein